jgi:large subunit ribosomal protein L23
MTNISIPKHPVEVLKKPRITEKAALGAEKGQYVFEVSDRATKTSVAKAIEVLYKVKPIKVNIVKLPAKTVFVRGKVGKKSGVKKAYVFVKKGDKIDLV